MANELADSTAPLILQAEKKSIENVDPIINIQGNNPLYYKILELMIRYKAKDNKRKNLEIKPSDIKILRMIIAKSEIQKTPFNKRVDQLISLALESSKLDEENKLKLQKLNYEILTFEQQTIQFLMNSGCDTQSLFSGCVQDRRQVDRAFIFNDFNKIIEFYLKQI